VRHAQARTARLSVALLDGSHCAISAVILSPLVAALWGAPIAALTETNDPGGAGAGVSV